MKTENLRSVSLADIIDLAIHPVADLFPMLPNEVRKDGGKNETLTLPELADSILENGLQEPIVLFTAEGSGETLLLDGRNRRAACNLVVEALGETPADMFIQVEDFIGTEEEADEYVLALNIDRRDLSPGQRAFVAMEYWDLVERKQGLRTDLSPTLGRSVVGAAENLAARFRVSKGYIEEARRISKKVTNEKNQAELASQEAERQRVLVEQKRAEAEAARGAQDATKAAEAVAAANRASAAADVASEKAATKATQVASAENRIDKVKAGTATMGSLVKDAKPEASDTDPTVRLRGKINSSFASFKQAVTELAEASGQGEDDWNFVGRKITDLIEHVEAAFGLLVDEEKSNDPYDHSIN